MNRHNFAAMNGKATKTQLLKVLTLQCRQRYNPVNYYVSPSRMCTIDFLREILSGRKSLKKMNQVRFVIGIEGYSDLTLANLLRYA